jgi:hypothetical protein
MLSNSNPKNSKLIIIKLYLQTKMACCNLQVKKLTNINNHAFMHTFIKSSIHLSLFKLDCCQLKKLTNELFTVFGA